MMIQNAFEFYYGSVRGTIVGAYLCLFVLPSLISVPFTHACRMLMVDTSTPLPNKGAQSRTHNTNSY